MAPPQLQTVSVEEFAKFHGLSPQRIHQLIDEGLPHRNAGGKKRIVPAKASVWMRERLRADDASADGLDKDQEIAEKTRVERQIKEMELAERRGSMVTVAQYQERIEEFVGGLAGVAMGQLQRFEREMVQAGDAAAARRLTGKIQAALMQGARDYADQLEAEIAATTEPEETAA